MENNVQLELIRQMIADAKILAADDQVMVRVSGERIALILADLLYVLDTSLAEVIDMAKASFTAGRVAGFKCPADRRQAFLWDAATYGLGLRATPAGSPAYVFQGRHQDKTVRVTIGSPDAWSIPDAQARARELQRLIDDGRDPREVKAERAAADVAKREAAKSDAVTVSELWAAYLTERRPHWGARATTVTMWR